ncbi:TonB-dependent receptor [Gaetbulibacter sp. M235]|uniref:SusC/RagA family TonB-linked outer membrane protein n=1 Tax=Gaetbulibacter sp. M235 TaxID=3126510 RepID=UPI00374F008D
MKIKLINVLFFFRKKLLLFIVRTFIFLLCISAFGLGPNNVLSQNSKIIVDYDTIMTVDEVFELIMKQTEYNFIYEQGLFKNLPKVKLSRGVIYTNDLLNKSLSTGDFNFDLTNNNTLIIREKTESEKQQQEISISGTVKDKDGLPLYGITVYTTNREPDFNDSNINPDFLIRGTATDFDGKFSLKVEVDNYLVISGLGYKTFSQKINENQKVYSITLNENTSSLEEVLVVGYGTTVKKDLTGSVGSVKAEDIQKIKTQSIENSLAGQISGVFVSPGTGEPGSGGTVIIRGLSQILGDNQPLYVVDGVPIVVNPRVTTVGGEFPITFSGTRQNPLLSIDPNNIERVDVLKDASAAAIYGSRAANGVVLITTKRGKTGQAPRMSFSVNTTLQTPSNTRDWASASEWKGFMTTLAQYDLDTTTLPDFLIPDILSSQYNIVNDPANYFGNANTDWEDSIINDSAIWNQYRLSINGGGDKVTYALSTSINEQEGVLIKNKFTRYNFAASIDAQVKENIKIGGSVNYNYSVNKTSGILNLNDAGFRPDFPIYDETGEFTFITGFYSNDFNPLGGLGRNRKKTIGKNMFGSLYGELKIVNDFKFKSQINLSSNDDDTESFVPSYNNGYNANAYGRPGATLYIQNNNTWSASFVNTINFNKKIYNHRIDAVVGVSWDQSKVEYNGVTYRGFPDDTNLINTGSAQFVEFPSSAHEQSGLNSMFSRVNYIYNDKYLVTFTARRDTSTKFGPGNRSGFFPSGALAWNVHNEEFFKNQNIIDLLKIRTSLGKTGSDNLDSFSYLAYYNTGTFYAGEAGITVDKIPNANIRWEGTNQFDIGLEFGLFNSRLNGEVVYFEKNTSDIILKVPVPAETGSGFWDSNVADVTNKGWEIVLGGDVLRTKDFNWNSSINISYIKNNVDRLNGGSTNGGSNIGIFEGHPIGSIEGPVVVSIAQTQAEIDDLNAASPTGVYDSNLKLPGDYIFKDLDGDGRITTDDRKVLGDINPNYFGGWNNRITYKNWDFGMNWTFASGIKKDYEVISFGWPFNSWDVNVDKLAIKESWTPENTGAKYARFGSRSNFFANSRSVMDASYIKLRYASIGYNLPTNLIKHLGISSAHISFSGNNLITITDYVGLDPEDAARDIFSTSGHTARQSGDDGSSYPNTRTFTLGLNITF